MKLFAIVGKSDRYFTVSMESEEQAWKTMSYIYDATPLNVFIEERKAEGYLCIELHTYDPSKQGVYDKEKQIVVDRDVYSYVSSYAKFHSDPFSDKFLKAGDMK